MNAPFVPEATVRICHNVPCLKPIDWPAEYWMECLMLLEAELREQTEAIPANSKTRPSAGFFIVQNYF